MTDLIDDPVPLLMQQVPGLSEQDARAAAQACAYDDVLEESERTGASLVERTYYLRRKALCTLGAIYWCSGSSAGDFDVDREDLYPNAADARAAWEEMQ